MYVIEVCVHMYVISERCVWVYTVYVEKYTSMNLSVCPRACVCVCLCVCLRVHIIVSSNSSQTEGDVISHNKMTFRSVIPLSQMSANPICRDVWRSVKRGLWAGGGHGHVQPSLCVSFPPHFPSRFKLNTAGALNRPGAAALRCHTYPC